MTSYVALLRGINVGGKNKIAMADLRACFEALGFADVRTYIQSGNVLFATGEAARERLVARLEAALSETFDYEARLALRSHEELAAIVAGAPRGFGGEPDLYRYNVIFLKGPLTAAEAMKHVSVREGVDEVHAGNGVLYHARLTSRATQSRMSRLTSTPIYREITIRNWRTTTRLLAMLAEG